MSFDLNQHLLASAISDEQHERNLRIEAMLAAMEYGDEDA